MPNNKLYIPVNIRRRKEYIDGFGIPERNIVIIWSIIGLMIGTFIFFISDENLFVSILVSFLIPSTVFVLIRKNAVNRSLVDFIKDEYKFVMSQKRYNYKYYNFLKSRDIK